MKPAFTRLAPRAVQYPRSAEWPGRALIDGGPGRDAFFVTPEIDFVNVEPGPGRR